MWTDPVDWVGHPLKAMPMIRSVEVDLLSL